MVYTFNMGEKLPVTALPNTEGFYPDSFAAVVTAGDAVIAVEEREEPLSIYITALSTGVGIVRLHVLNTADELLTVDVEVQVLAEPATELTAIVGEPVPA